RSRRTGPGGNARAARAAPPGRPGPAPRCVRGWARSSARRARTVPTGPRNCAWTAPAAGPPCWRNAGTGCRWRIRIPRRCVPSAGSAGRRAGSAPAQHRAAASRAVRTRAGGGRSWPWGRAGGGVGDCEPDSFHDPASRRRAPCRIHTSTEPGPWQGSVHSAVKYTAQFRNSLPLPPPAHAGPDRSPQMSRTVAALPLVLCLCLLAACGGEDAPAQPPPPEVGVIAVESTDLPLTREIGGRLAGFRSADVRARVPGVLQKRVYEEGSGVEEGDVLCLIDPAPLQAALGTAQASLAQAQANYANAKANADRARQLAPTDF